MSVFKECKHDSRPFGSTEKVFPSNNKKTRTFLLAFAPSSPSALLLALGLEGATWGNFFGSTGVVTLEERLGAGCSALASTAGALRGGISCVLLGGGGNKEGRNGVDNRLLLVCQLVELSSRSPPEHHA